MEVCKKTYIEPSSKHPCAMLLDLKSFDIDVRDDEANEYTNPYESHPSLDFEAATERMSSNHQSTNQADSVEQKCCVSRNPVDDDPTMANEGGELEDSEDACWEHATKVKQDSDLITVEVEVVVALSGSGAVST
jgi:hypothetical protein